MTCVATTSNAGPLLELRHRSSVCGDTPRKSAADDGNKYPVPCQTRRTDQRSNVATSDLITSFIVFSFSASCSTDGNCCGHPAKAMPLTGNVVQFEGTAYAAPFRDAASHCVSHVSNVLRRNRSSRPTRMWGISPSLQYS